jgi:hypothetical protein
MPGPIRWKWLIHAAIFFTFAALVWVLPNIEAANSMGEKDFGVGILAGVAMVISPLCALIGVVYVVATFLEYRIQRRQTR